MGKPIDTVEEVAQDEEKKKEDKSSGRLVYIYPEDSPFPRV